MSKGIFWFPCFVGAEGELIFTDRIEARITSETAAPISPEGGWKKERRGKPLRRFPGIHKGTEIQEDIHETTLPDAGFYSG